MDFIIAWGRGYGDVCCGGSASGLKLLAIIINITSKTYTYSYTYINNILNTQSLYYKNYIITDNKIWLYSYSAS